MIARMIVHTLIAVTMFAGAAFAASDSEGPTYDVGQPAIEQWFPAIREAAEGLPDHTVYRPADMRRFKRNSVPVIVWANGACRRSNLGFMISLTTLAHHGFVVIANGAFDAPINVTTPVTPEFLIQAINWAISGDHKGQFQNRLDPEDRRRGTILWWS
jgi:hypothetical protein